MEVILLQYFKYIRARFQKAFPSSTTNLKIVRWWIWCQNLRHFSNYDLLPSAIVRIVYFWKPATICKLNGLKRSARQKLDSVWAPENNCWSHYITNPMEYLTRLKGKQFSYSVCLGICSGELLDKFWSRESYPICSGVSRNVWVGTTHSENESSYQKSKLFH
jgi:hypothetical protein